MRTLRLLVEAYLEMIFIMDYKSILKKAGAIFLALAFWQILAMKIHQRILLVSPIEVAVRLGTIWQEKGFFPSVWFTFSHITAGFLLGLVCGTVLAMAASRWKPVETLLWPWMATIKSVPVASFIVICLIWLSVQRLSVFISFLIVLPVVYQNTLEGLKNIDVKLEQMSRVYGLTWYRKLKYITIPALRPFIISACSVSCGMAWKAGVAAEIIGVPNGSIGKQLYNAKIYLATEDLLAWTVIIVLISVIFEKVFMWAVRRILREGTVKQKG